EINRSDGAELEFDRSKGVSLSWGGQVETLQVQYGMSYSGADINRYTSASDTKFSGQGELETTRISLEVTNNEDFPDLGKNWSNYWGMGVGFQRSTISDLTIPGEINVDADSKNFTYQFLAGIEYLLSDHQSLSLDYRFLASREQTFQNQTTDKQENWDGLQEHSFGLKYTWRY
ncbi:MAG: outer membrane protein, partial [bacterium]